MPGSAAPNQLQSHRYAGFAENGDDDSDDEEDIGHTFEMVCISDLRLSRSVLS